MVPLQAPSYYSPPADPGSGSAIRDSLETEPLPVQEFPWVEAGIAVALALLIGLAVLLWRRRFRREAVDSPEVRARGRLWQLAAQDGPERGVFYGKLAAILVDYMEATVGLRGSRRTSAEIVRAFRRNGRMSEAWQQRLELFLAECDRAKFAGPSDVEWDAAAALAECRAILEALAVEVAVAPRIENVWEGWDAAV
jgi:hypothetical protein